MKFRLHPILFPFFLFLIFTDGLSMYALIFFSLLIHEAGHIIAARCCGMTVRTCTIYPYGGELFIPNRFRFPKSSQIIVALGGPFATTILLCAAMWIPLPGADDLFTIQLFMLGVNLLPIMPLDGGQVLVSLLERENNHLTVQTFFLQFSIIILMLSIILFSFHLPNTILYMILCIFLLFQNIGAFRYRKYQAAFIQLTRKQLTQKS